MISPRSEGFIKKTVLVSSRDSVFERGWGGWWTVNKERGCLLGVHFSDPTIEIIGKENSPA